MTIYRANDPAARYIELFDGDGNRLERVTFVDTERNLIRRHVEPYLMNDKDGFVEEELIVPGLRVVDSRELGA